jgi:hypothetical protein
LDGVVTSDSDSEEDSNSGDSSLESSRHSLGDPSGGILHGDRGVAKGIRPFYQGAISKHEWEEFIILEGAWPGSQDTALLTQFVKVHFAGSWEEYLPFADWADSCNLEAPGAAINISKWSSLKTGNREQGDKQPLAKEGHSLADDNDSRDDSWDAGGSADQNFRGDSMGVVNDKTLFLGADSIPPTTGKKGVLEGKSPPVAKRLFNSSRNSPHQSSSKPPGQQIDIRSMLVHTPTHATNEEAAQKAMEEDNLQQEK